MRIIYLFFMLAIGILLTGNSAGAGASQGVDRTGGPLSQGFCGNCHAQGAFNPSLDVVVLKDGEATSEYEAGMAYTLRITVNADAGAEVYGFQAVALTGDTDENAGLFDATTGTQTLTLDSRIYAEQSMRSESNVFNIPWTAPATSTGEDVRFYVAAVAANNAAGSGGDGAAFLSTPVVLSDVTVSTEDLADFGENMSVFPNPVSTNLNLSVELEEAKDGMIHIINTAGQAVLTESRFFHQGLNTFSFDVADLPTGHYWLEVGNQDGRSRKAVLKK